MTTRRRRSRGTGTACRLFLLAALLVPLAPGARALAQPSAGYPAKTVRIVAPYAPGGAVDALARLIAQALTQRFGKSVIVENRPGAGGNIGLAAIAKAESDGHTLGIGEASTLAAKRFLYTS